MSAHTRWSQSTTGGDCTPVVRYIIASKKKSEDDPSPEDDRRIAYKEHQGDEKKTFVKRNKLVDASSLKTIENHVDETEIVKTRCVREQ